MGKTKAEEREALVKIGQILEDFSPEDTYIGRAFEGCVEQAEENLSSDWMMSYKGRYDDVSEQLHAANARIVSLTIKLHKSEEARVDLTSQLNLAGDAIARLKDANNQLSEVSAQRDIDQQEMLCRFEAEKAQNLCLKQTILELKAKLYDMMTREEVKG